MVFKNPFRVVACHPHPNQNHPLHKGGFSTRLREYTTELATSAAQLWAVDKPSVDTYRPYTNAREGLGRWMVGCFLTSFKGMSLWKRMRLVFPRGAGKGGALLKALELSAMSRPGQYKTGDAVPTIPGSVQTGTVINLGKLLD